MSRIYATTERAVRAVETDKAALQINPFLWSSFEASCNSDDADINPHKLFDTERLKNFSQCFGINPILSYANNEPSTGVSTTRSVKHNHQTSNNQNHVPIINQNSRHLSSTSTPIIPSAIPPNIADQITNKNTCNIKPPVSSLTHQENVHQISSMTTMITPVNQMLFESTLGTNTRNETNDSCFTG